MGNIGWTQILIIVVLIVLFFGRGKISEVMGDVAKGIKNFRQGLSEDEGGDQEPQPGQITQNDAASSGAENKQADASFSSKQDS